MENFLRKKNFFLILMYLFFYSNQKPFKFTLYSNITAESELNPLHFDFDYICNGWIPSLINPILIIPESKTIDNDYLHKEKGKIHLADILFKPLSFDCDLYELFFNNTYNTFIGQCPLEEYQENMHYRDCYFGLSPSVPKETESSEKIGHNLALLTNNHTIDNKIFSFEKWEIKDNLISSKFLIGDSHDHFKVEDGYIGQCKMTDNEYWGCSFKEMTFNNAIISLSKEDKTLYKIYFASETNDIILPNKFRNILVDASNKKCYVKIGDIDYYLFCDDLNDQGYIPLRLSNEDMNITLEIDYAFNYSKNTEILKSKTRIKFQDINYMIFPLMMFKRFDIEFNANNKMISFYTKNSSILEVPEKPKKPSSSSVLTVFLVILIILIVIAGAVGIYFLVKKKFKRNIESDINKFSRFDDDEDFQNINEKRVF
jgi:hypothetical protein